MPLEFEYNPLQPGTEKTGLPAPVPHANERDPYTMTADKLDALERERAEDIAFNEEALVDEYVKHEGVMLAYDTLIDRLDKIATTEALKKELLTLRAGRQTMDRLLFSGGQELRKDESTWRV